MIEPTSQDVRRAVQYRNSEGAVVTGVVTSFNAEYVFVSVDSTSVPIRREQLSWLPASKADAKAAAARSRLEGEGLTIVEIDEHSWKIVPQGDDAATSTGYVFWPGTGLWRRPDGTRGGGDVQNLIAAIKAVAR